MSHATVSEASNTFLKHETAFHLGEMLTEQSHPLTRHLSQTLAGDTASGIEMLLRVDDDIPPVARRVVESEAFRQLRDDIFETLRSGNHVYFSGCGATGRLAILLDAAHRRFCSKCTESVPARKDFFARLAEQTFSVMTGGDFALIRSVESFEDFIVFGRRQLLEAGFGSRDCLVAISEGGETSSVIGTIHAALEAGAKTHFLYNNPTELMCRMVERSRRVMTDPRVNLLCLATGPMAVAGSTRMQATTIEMLVAGTAFEAALMQYLEETLKPGELEAIGSKPVSPTKALGRFDGLLEQIRLPRNLDTLARLADLENTIYSEGGLVTYFPDGYTLDIFTDTTERSPTFKIPPFRSTLEPKSPVSWAFVKDPVRDTEAAWRHLLGRAPVCIEWTSKDYHAMNAPERIVAAPPNIGRDVLGTYPIGREEDATRYGVSPNIAVAFLAGDECFHFDAGDSWADAFLKASDPYEKRAAILIGPRRSKDIPVDGPVFHIEVDLPWSPLDLTAHLAIKLALNNVSTATMGKIGRLSGNWMAHVDATNKKLIDRSIRIISELTRADYASACYALFESMEEMNTWPESLQKTTSPAIYTVKKLNKALTQ